VSDEMDAPEALSPRARRAMPLIAGALATIVVVGLVYLHPTFPTSHSLLRVSPSPTPPLIPLRYLASYDFLTASAGWSLVEEGTTAAPRFWVFKTTDAARHWQRQFAGSAMSTNAGPLTIQFFDRNNGLIALGGTDVVYRTGDGGAHWIQLTMPTFSFSQLFFSDKLHGWILGTVQSLDQRTSEAKFYSTTDAGDHWVALPQPPTFPLAGKGGFSELAFRGPGEGWMGGFAQQSSAYSTVDGGVTWQAHKLPVTIVGKGGFAEGSPPLVETSVSLLPGAGVLAVAFDPNASPIGLTSFDGGSTWRRIAPPPGSTSYSDFVFQDAFHWWAMRFGTLFKSSDAGQTWKQVSLQLDEWDYVLQVIDARHAWAQLVVTFPRSTSVQGTGLSTTVDGGLHWNPVDVPRPS
jgi:photosystem II stability/assembly factor-like uncharacterized protein